MTMMQYLTVRDVTFASRENLECVNLNIMPRSN